MPQNLVNPFGRVVSVPDDQVESAIQQGYGQAAPEQVEHARMERDYGGVGHTIAAAGVGALRGATLGLSDVALAEIGGEDMRHQLDAYQQVNPYASAAGELGGAIVGAGKLVKGAGALSKGVRVLTAPSRGAAILGETAGGLLQGTRLGGGAIQMGLQAGVEGAFFGAGSALSESAIHNTDLTGEKLFASMGHGALLGGGIGFGIGATAKVAGMAVRGVGELAKGAFGHAAPGLAKAWAKASGLAGREGAEALSILGRLDDVGAAARQRAIHAPERLAAEADGFAERLGNVEKRIRRAEELFTGDLKADQIAKSVRRGNEAEVAMHTRQTLDDLRARLGGMLDDEAGYASAGLKKLQKKVDRVDRVLSKAEGSADLALNEKAMMQLDSLKRDIGKQAVKYGRRRTLMSDEQATYGALKEMYEGNLMPLLENRSVWGDAALIQQRMNAPWHNLITKTKHGKFYNNFTETVEGAFGKRASRVSRDKVGRVLDSITNPNESEAIQGLLSRIDSGEDFVNVARENLRLTSSDAKLLDELGGELTGLRGHLDEVTETATRRNQLRILEQGSDESAILGGAVGYAAASGNPLLAAAGALLGPVLNPARGVRTIAAVETIAKRVGSRMDGGIARLVSGAAPLLARGAVTSEEYNLMRSRVEQWAMAPQESRDDVKRQLGVLAYGAPMAVESTIATADRAAGYLAKHLPQSPIPAAVFAEPIEPSGLEIQRWMDRAYAIDDPISILDEAASGDVSPDSVDAVKNVFPALYEDMRSRTMTKLLELKENGKEPPYDRAVQIGTLFDLPVDPTMDPEVLHEVQLMYAETPTPTSPAQGGGGGPVLNLSKHFKSSMQRAEEGDY